MPTATNNPNPTQVLPTISLTAAFSSLNGELFVLSGFPAVEVKLGLSLTVVAAAATLVVTRVVESVLLSAESEDGADVCIIVFVIVDCWVVVLPRESVVVYVLITPG